MKFAIVICCLIAFSCSYQTSSEEEFDDQFISELEGNQENDDRAYKVEGDNTKFTPPDESLVDISPPDDSLVQNKEVEDDENLSNDKIDLDPSEDKMIAPDERDDPVVVDGDLLVSKEQAAIYYKEGWDGLVNSEAWARKRRWGRVIRYKCSRKIRGSVRSNLFRSIRAIQARTCVRFRRVRWSYIRPHLSFKRGRGCFVRFLGRPLLGARRVFLKSSCAGGNRIMTPAHEIMHAMGRWHEQTRPDRDRFVTVNPNTCSSQFRINRRARTFGIGYDYFSVMHYSRWQCPRNGRPSMSFPRGINPDDVGQRRRLSARDVEHINVIHCRGRMMRLRGGEGPYEGRVEVNSDNVWGTMCSNGFDTNDAEVVCKYLGHPAVERVSTSVEGLTTKNLPIWMSNLMCTGQEFSPFHCKQAPIGSHDCTHDQDVSVKCSKAAKLIGDSDNRGHLQVYHEEKWVSVCSHKFGHHEAKVACRMMGFTGAVQVFTNSEETYETTAANDENIFISELKCDGTEDHLSSCEYEDDARGCAKGSPVHLHCKK